MTRPTRRGAPFPALLAALVAIAATACSGRDDPDRHAASVAQMLRQRGARLAAGDLDGYLAAVAPEARPLEERIARGARSVPLTRMEMALAPGAGLTVAGETRVVLRYGYEGLPPDNVFRIPLAYELLRRADSWLVTSSRLADGVKLPPWGSGPVEVARSGHFLALTRPGAIAEPVLELAEQARARMIGRVRGIVEEAHLLLVARSAGELEQMSAGRPPANIVAQAEMLFEVTPQAVEVGGRQIIVNLELAGRPAALRAVLEHELAHLLLARDTRPFTPAWLREGMAMYLSGIRPARGSPENARRFGSLSFGQLVAGLGPGGHSAAGGSLEYEYAAAGVAYLAEVYGEARVWDLYRRFPSIPPGEVFRSLPQGVAPGDPAVVRMASEVTRRALGDLFALDERGLDRSVREWVAR